MLQKAIIEQKIDKYSMKVRIPVYNKIKSDPTATPTEELYTAIIQTLPGCSPVYQEGDLVIVDFENGNLAYPVIIGLLYREDMPQGSTDVVADSLKVNVNTDLTENTFIGYVTPDSIKKLNDKYQNNVKKVVVEYSLSNYEDHYDQFSQWSEQAPQFWPGKFMWQRTTVTYENDLITRSMTCIQGAKGDPGSSITIVDNYVKYAINNSGTEHPSTSAQNVWYENPPQTTDVNPYLWSWTYVLFSDGTSNDTFSVARTSANSIIVYLYKRSDTEISQIDWSNTLTYNFDTKRFSTLPTGWSSDIPSGNDPIYVTAATVSSVNTQGYVTAASWSTPMLFTKSGFNSKTIQLYKRSATAPSAPSTTVTYTFSTGGISPSSPNGWSLGVPTSNGNPCYVVQATAISYEDTDTITSGEWSSPTIIAQDGDSDYIDQPIVDWYKATSTTTVPTTPTSDIEVASEWTTLGWTNNINSITLSETNKYLWNAEVTHYSITGYVKTNAHIITVYAESGAGILSSTIYYYVDTQGATPPADSASWSTTFPSSIQQGQYLWTKTVTEYTDSSIPDSVVYSVSRDGETGSDGKGITSIVEYYAINNSDTTPPTVGSSDWHTTPMNPTSSNRYLWSYQVISYTTGSPTTTTPHVISMYAEDGAAGSNAATVFLYQRAESASSLTKPTGDLTYTFSTGILSGTLGNWTQSIPASDGNPCFVIQATAVGTGTTDTIASSEWSNIVELVSDGEDGTNGISITGVTEYFAVNNSNTTAPTSGWSTSFTAPTSSNKYVWNYERITYSSGSPTDTTPAIIGMYSADGNDGRSITGVVNYYLATNQSSGVTTSTSGWTTTVQSVSTSAKYLWNYEVIQYDSGSPTTTTPCIIGAYGETGSPGANGLNNAVVYLYKRTSSTATIDWTSTLTYTFSTHTLDTVPTGWNASIPSGTDPLYVTAATASSNTGSDQIAYTEWATPIVLAENGSNGSDGANSATVFLYQRAASASSISKPSGTLTYTFATGTLSGTLGNWSQTIPTSDGNPCFVIQATAVSATPTDTIASSEWSNIVELVSDGQDGSPGTNGLNNAIVYLYKRSSTAATVDWTSTLTYNFTNKALESTPTGWAETIPSGTNPIYVTAASASSNTNTDTIAYTEWSSPVVLAQNGTNGTNGRSITGVVNYYLATNLDSGVTRSTSGWTTTIQNVSGTNKYLWNYEEVTYSSGSPTYTDPCIIGAYGDNGQTGVGISSITEYYALSTTTTRPTSGWSTTLPEMDATNRYLWNYSVVTYTNGSSSGTSNDALIIGVYGDSVISLEIQSDNGTLFNSKTLSSTLSTIVYLGSAQLTVANNGTVTNGGTTIGQLSWFAKERFVGNGTAVTFDTGLDILNYNNNPTIEVTIDGTVTTAYSISDQNTIVFTTAPTEGSVIIISYLTSTSGSLLVQRTDVRNQIVVTCKLVSGVNTIATAEVTIKDLNDATSLQTWYMLTVPNAEFISLPTVIYDSSDYTVTPTGSYSYQVLDPNTQTYSEHTATFTWDSVAPTVDTQNGSNITCVCYSFQMIIFYDNSCSAGTVERNATFDSAVSAYYQAQSASDAASQAQSTANQAADGVQSNSDKITGIQSTLTAIDGTLASKLDTVVFQPYQDNIDSFIQFDIPSSTMTLGQGNFKQQLSATKNSFMEGSTEVAYISNQELYINNTTVNNQLSLDQEWVITFDSTNGLIVKHF